MKKEKKMLVAIGLFSCIEDVDEHEQKKKKENGLKNGCWKEDNFLT